MNHSEALCYVDGMLAECTGMHVQKTPTELTAFLIGIFKSMGLTPGAHPNADLPALLAAAEQRHREALRMEFVGADQRRN